ncbi:mucin-5AC [Drosophila montana]|uniref:mucin-5AC n=1 Tax=Drosophila montana TaxID=40370 RepID=UPI00313B08CC
MESIVLHSDIARLILGYFVNNNLKRAALTLCRTSPHLHQEFVALRQGLQPHNFLNDGLEEIIREHVKITSMVATAVQKLPNDARQRLQQLKLSERVGELLKVDKSTFSCSKDSATMQNASSNKQRKRRRMDEEHANSASPSPSKHAARKRRRLLDPHLYCSVGRSSRNVSDHTEEKDSLDSSTGTDFTSEHSDDALHFHGHGPKNNSTPRTSTSVEAERVMPTPQTMPALTNAIMTNSEFQAKLLTNINVALQSLTVHAPSAESVNSEAVLDGLVRNILEATEKDPSFDRIIQEVVSMEAQSEEPMTGTLATAAAATEPAPPQTPLIIRAAVSSANSAAAVNANGEVNVVNGNNGNAIIQLNANNSIGTLIDPNFSISKLIVLNSNESAQKQQQPSANLSFCSENLINYADGGSALSDADAVAGVAAVAGGQVCVDAINGQLTFPMFLSNEGLISHLPFLVNNEWLAQQLRSDAFANTDVSHIEIPLPEPITVTANQLPPNSIIINSAVKQPPTPVESPSVEPPAQLIAEQPKPVTASTVLVERSASKVLNASAVPASLDSSRLVLERVTPSTSGIVNVKAFRSLSTPRKRTSHVRTLNFSPKGVTHSQSTPLSTRRLQQRQQTQSQQAQRRAELKTRKEKQAKEPEKQTDLQPEKPVIIKNVEILPNFGSSSCVPAAAVTASSSSSAAAAAAAAAAAVTTSAAAAAVATAADVSGNESNGCVPPLFAMEETSNQTVIKAVTASKQPKQTAKSATPVAAVAPSTVATPKRKQKRRTAAKAACKRIIPEAQSQDEGNAESGNKQQQAKKSASVSLDDSKENQTTPTEEAVVPGAEKPKVSSEKEDLLAAWQRQMNSSSTDLEQRLREINAKRLDVFQNKVRRNRPVAKKKKTLAPATPLAPKQKKLKSPPLSTKKKKQKLKQQQMNSAEGDFIIKITTPQKAPKRPKAVSQKLKESKKHKVAKESKKIMEAEETKKIMKPEQPEHVQQQQPEQQQREEQVRQQMQQPDPAPVKAETKDKPAERIGNIEVLLETPFKVTLSEANDVPPTPGPALMSTLNTPYAKLLPSASFLFGSDTKSILDTPMLTAITPGMRLTTPFGHALSTPHSSAAKTDYSSGSSYYRPDEAEHTDTNAQCALQPTPKRDHVEQVAKQSTTCIELYAERVPVEPMVLRRVRSFGSEAVDSADAAALSGNAELQLVETPHYKLVGGLPDAVVDHSSSSSSGSSTSSSSSSSSSSGSCSHSSSNTTAGSAHTTQVTNAVLPACTIKLLELENLSDISSTEDEEWVKAAAAAGSLNAPPLAIDSEAAQLVSQDGEVRYPLRNWLTPSKDAAATAAAAADADTSGEMAPPAPPAPPAAVPAVKKATPTPKIANEVSQQVESIEQRMLDLAKVRERVKAKVKQQTAPKGRPKKPNKKLTTMRDTAKLTNPNPIHANKSPKKESQTTKPEKKAKVSATATESVKNEPAPCKPVKAKAASSEPVKAISEPQEPSSSNLDPALLIALNLSAKKQQQQPKTARATVQIAAKPAPSTSTGQRRGRPKKPPNTEPSRCSMRRSSRLIDNKTPAPEEPQPGSSEATKPAKASTSTKVAKKPAKKRAEARMETVALTLATLAEAQTTQLSPEQLPPQAQSPAPVASGEYELDMCTSASHVANTFCFAFADSGSKPAQPVPRQPPAYFTNFQMRIMVDSEMHTVRITSPQLLHQAQPSTEDNANATCIRNIPKKRIIRFTSGTNQDQAVAQEKPMAASTPLARNAQSEERDDNDSEVASINTPLKGNTSEEQQLEGHDAGVQIEDIESILSHLHGT